MLSKLDRENLKIKLEIICESILDKFEYLKSCCGCGGRKPAILGVVVLVLFITLRTFQKGVGMTFKTFGRGGSSSSGVGGLRGGYTPGVSQYNRAAGGWQQQQQGSLYGNGQTQQQQYGQQNTQYNQQNSQYGQQNSQYGQQNSQYGQNNQYNQQNTQYGQQSNQYGSRVGGQYNQQYGQTMQQQQQQQQYGQTNSFGQVSQYNQQQQQQQQSMQYNQNNYNYNNNNNNAQYNGQTMGQYNNAGGGTQNQYGQNIGQYGGGGGAQAAMGQYNTGGQMGVQYGRPR